METVNLQTRMYGDDGLLERLRLAVRHDFLLYGGQGEGQVKEESLYEWLRWVTNKRLSEISKGIR